MKHPAAVTQFGYFPLVLRYIKRASNNISFADIQQNLIRKNYELQAKAYDSSFEDGEILQPPSRQGKGRYTDMYGQLSQILKELIHLGLVEIEDRRNDNSYIKNFPTQIPKGDITEDWICHLTSEGEDLLHLVVSKKYLEFKVRYFNLMFNYFPIISKLLQAVHNSGKDNVVLPHVTAQQLGLETLDLEKPEDLALYLEKVADSVLSIYYGEVINPSPQVYDQFRSQLSKWQRRILETSQQYSKRGRKYPRFLIVARIRDYCVTYFTHVLTGDSSISGRSLEALSSRLSKMEIMGYSDYIYKGRLLFLCSWVVPLLKAPSESEVSRHYKHFSLIPSDSDATAYSLILHQPEYSQVKSKFEESLIRTFDKLHLSQHKQFISIPDLRENVCLDLKISAKTFDKLIMSAYNDSYNGESNLEITLASDPGYVEYALERWHRAPLILEGRHLTLIRIRERIMI